MYLHRVESSLNSREEAFALSVEQTDVTSI